MGEGQDYPPLLAKISGLSPLSNPKSKLFSEQLKQKKTKGSDEDFEDFCYKNSDLKKKLGGKKIKNT